MWTPIPFKYIFLLLVAGVVLALVMEFGAAIGDAMSGDERSDEKLDRRVLFRLALVGGAAALAVAAAIIIGYSLNPQRTQFLLASLRDNPPSLLLAGMVLCLVALLCDIKPRQPLLLVCLTLPGLVMMALLWLANIVKSNYSAEATFWVSVVFFLQPGVLILLIIASGQSRLLRKPSGKFTPGGLTRLFLIAFAYAYGLFPI